MSAQIAAGAAREADRWEHWDRFLETSSTTGFMQSSWWAEFRTNAGYEHFGIVLSRRDAVAGGALVMKYHCDGGCFYYIPEGPVLPTADESLAGAVFEAVLQSIESDRSNRSETVSHLRIEPRWCSVPAFVRGFRRVPAFMDSYMEPRDTLLVDLRPPEPEILAQMKQKGRYNIHVARKHGVTVTEDPSAQGLRDFLAIYKDMAERQGLSGKPTEYFEKLVSTLLSRQKGSLFFAEYQGTRLAVALVVYFGGRATYFFGASLDRDRRVMAPYLLHFEIMRRMKALGCQWYDLWGIAPSGAAEHPWQNISAFKHKFGGCEINLVPSLDYVYDAAAYEQYLSIEATHRRVGAQRGAKSGLNLEASLAANI